MCTNNKPQRSDSVQVIATDTYYIPYSPKLQNALAIQFQMIMGTVE